MSLKKKEAAASQTKPPAAASDKAPKSSSKVAALEGELKEMKDRYLRLCAELENYKKHMQREQQAWGERMAKRIFLGLIPAFNDLSRILETPMEDLNKETFSQGLKMAQSNLLKALEKEGLVRVVAEQDADFNEEYHQALSTVAEEEETKKNKIVQVVAHGYQLHGQTIYPAQVIVSK